MSRLGKFSTKNKVVIIFIGIFTVINLLELVIMYVYFNARSQPIIDFNTGIGIITGAIIAMIVGYLSSIQIGKNKKFIKKIENIIIKHNTDWENHEQKIILIESTKKSGLILHFLRVISSIVYNTRHLLDNQNIQGPRSLELLYYLQILDSDYEKFIKFYNLVSPYYISYDFHDEVFRFIKEYQKSVDYPYDKPDYVFKRSRYLILYTYLNTHFTDQVLNFDMSDLIYREEIQRCINDIIKFGRKR